MQEYYLALIFGFRNRVHTYTAVLVAICANKIEPIKVFQG